MRYTGIYKHINFLDVVMEVTKVQYRGPEYIKVKVRWLLERNGEFLGAETLKVKRKDLPKWKVVNHG